MSQENVEIVRRVYDAINRRDWDAVFRDAHPDFDMTTQRGLNAGELRRRDAAEGFLEDFAPPPTASTRPRVDAFLPNRCQQFAGEASVGEDPLPPFHPSCTCTASAARNEGQASRPGPQTQI
jgi:hypothetical protein